MPKPHFSEAPDHVKKKFELARQDMEVPCPNGERVSAVAAGQLSFLRAVYREGFFARPEDVEQPVHARLAKLTESGAIVAAASLKKRMGVEIDFERRCALLVESMAVWATKPSRFELQEAERKEREAADRQAAIDRRTLELVSSERRKKSADATARARKQAERELSAEREVGT